VARWISKHHKLALGLVFFTCLAAVVLYVASASDVAGTREAAEKWPSEAAAVGLEPNRSVAISTLTKVSPTVGDNSLAAAKNKHNDNKGIVESAFLDAAGVDDSLESVDLGESWQDMIEREHALGRFSMDDVERYETYSMEALEQLGDAGDLLALQMLYARHLENTDLEAAYKAAYKSVLHGSADALNVLSGEDHFLAIKYEQEENREKSLEHWAKLSAWYEVAALYGDDMAYQLKDTLLANSGVDTADLDEQFIANEVESLLLRIEQDRARIDQGAMP